MSRGEIKDFQETIEEVAALINGRVQARFDEFMSKADVVANKLSEVENLRKSASALRTAGITASSAKKHERDERDHDKGVSSAPRNG